MSRTLPTGYLTVASGKVFKPVFLVELQWATGTVRAWNGYGNISWGGNTFYGTGALGMISAINEAVGTMANGVTLTLSGIPTSIINEALNQASQGRPAKIWITSLTEAGAFAVDPYQIFEGVIDQCVIEVGGDTSTVSVTLEKELADRRFNVRRYTYEDQLIDYPGDVFFDHVTVIANKEFTWGSATASAQGLTPGALYPTAVGLVKFENGPEDL